MATGLDGMLGFTPADLAGNRSGRLSEAQTRRLWWSGIWRELVGPPLVVFGGTLALVSDWFLAVVIGLACLAGGLYLAWRGYAFVADAVTVDVAWVVGELTSDVVRSRSSVTYYAVIGPVRQRVSRSVYQELPVGTRCNLYYAPGCRALLSVEPADAGEPRPDHPFGADAAHAWDRLRWRWVAITVALVGLFGAGHILVDAHPARAIIVTGTVSDWYETTHKGNVTEHLYLAADGQDYTPDSADSYQPPVPSFRDLVGTRVELYVNQGTTDVIALRAAGDTLYAGSYYLHPEQQTYWTWLGGAVVLLVAVVGLLIAAWPLVRTRRRSGTPVGEADLARLTPPSVRGAAIGGRPTAVMLSLLVVGVAAMIGLIGISAAIVRVLGA